MDIVKSITDLFGSALEEMKKRVTSPLAGTFFISWFVFNWRLVYYFLTSDKDTVEKIYFIDMMYIDLKTNLIWPVAITFSYITFYPFFSSLANTIWILMERFAKYLSTFVLEKSTRITKDEQRRMYELMRQKENEYRKELEDKQESIDALYASLGSLTSDSDDKEEDEDSGNILRASSSDVLFSAPMDKPSNKDASAPPLNSSVPAYLETQDGIYYLEDLIADEMNLDKDDKHHKNDIFLAKSIIKEVVSCYPEPWQLKELNINFNGASRRFPQDSVHSKVKILVNIGWLEESKAPKGRSFVMSPSLIHELNFIKRR